MSGHQQVMQFPMEFPVKVMGLNSEAFSAAVHAIVARHLKPGSFTISRRQSSADKYLSLTITFMAESREQLDALYLELNRHELVKMTL